MFNANIKINYPKQKIELLMRKLKVANLDEYVNKKLSDDVFDLIK